MVNISGPEGTIFETLYNSIMNRWLFGAVFLACSFAAACGGESTRTSDAPAATSVATPEPARSLPKIVAFGDSLTAGYGLPQTLSYPSLLQKKLDARGFRYEVVNAGISGDTSAGGVRRVDWALDGDVRIVILELGANDILRGQPVEEMRKNLSQIIIRAKARGARVLLAGMEAPTNSGLEYRRAVHQAFPQLAAEHGATLIPFLLSGVAGVDSLNQVDGIHPNEQGTEIVAETVFESLLPLLQKPAPSLPQGN
jgi:acyl-CoA thioesterase-1